MATTIPRLQDETYLNWLRCSVALLTLKEGLENFTDKRVSDFHQELHTKVPQPYSKNGPLDQLNSQQQAVSCVQICKTCSHNEVQRHHHTWRVRCPSKVCSTWIKNILKYHVDGSNCNIAYTNLKPQLWPSHPWEVAKLFLPYGCERINSARDADVAAVLKLLRNCLFMYRFMKDHSLVEEVLGIRHGLMHSNTLTVSDDQLKNATDRMIELLKSLEDLTQTEREIFQRTIDTITKLQSKTTDLPSNKEVVALRARMLAVDSELQSLRTQCLVYDQTRLDLNRTSDEVQSLSEDYQKTKSEIDKLQETRDQFENFLKENDLVQNMGRMSTVLQQLDQKLEQQDVRTSDLNQRLDQQALKIHSLEEQLTLKADTVTDSLRSWDEQCKDLQTLLMSHYKNTCLVIQNPIENNDVGLEFLYVDPAIKVLRESKGRDGLKNVVEEAASMSCKKMFYTDDYKCRQIYVTGNAGTGKSMLCRNIVLHWCEAHGGTFSVDREETGNNSDEEYVDMQGLYRTDRNLVRKKIQDERKARREEDKQIMLQFVFLFYITLRDSLSEYSVSEMIQSQILKHYDTVKDASVLLKKERCLIIVDGLDEWVCPEGRIVPHFMNSGIPGRDISNENNVFLTTTRPWKFDVLQLKSSEVDKHIELCGLSEQSSIELCSIMITLLNTRSPCRKNKQNFFKTLHHKGLDHFQTVPVILIQLICLWFDNQELCQSQIQLYSAMLNLLLKKAQKNLSAQTTNTQTCVPSATTLPKCIMVHSYCKKHQHLINCLSKLAFESLFGKTKENSLVFQSSQMEIFGLGQESINMCLNSGILCQNKVLEKCSVSEKKLSFLHKKFQEFLAAIFIASCDDAQAVIKHLTDICTTLSAYLEMSQVWLFLAGLSPDITHQLLARLTRIVTVDKEVQNYRQILYGEHLIEDIQKCITDCIEEGRENGTFVMYDDIHLEDFSITKDTLRHVKQLFLCSEGARIKSVHLLCSDIYSKELKTIQDKLQQCQSIQKLHVFDMFARCLPSDILLHIVINNCNTLTCLHLESRRIIATADIVKAICSSIGKCLKALHLFDIKLSHDCKEQILNSLSQSQYIRELKLKLRCTEHGIDCRAGIDLFRMELKSLEMKEVFVDDLHCISNFVEMVDVWDSALTVTSLCEFANQISQTGHDVNVNIGSVTVIDSSNRQTDIQEFLHGCPNLEVESCWHDDNIWFIIFHTSSQESN